MLDHLEHSYTLEQLHRFNYLVFPSIDLILVHGLLLDYLVLQVQQMLLFHMHIMHLEHLICLPLTSHSSVTDLHLQRAKQITIIFLLLMSSAAKIMDWSQQTQPALKITDPYLLLLWKNPKTSEQLLLEIPPTIHLERSTPLVLR